MDEVRGAKKDLKPNCRDGIEKILAVQRETRNLLIEVVGPPAQDESKDAEAANGSLAEMECDIRRVERHARLLFDMVTDLHDRL